MKNIELTNGYYWNGYKFKIYPTESQKEFIDRNINLSRYVYNWALAKQEEHSFECKILGVHDKLYYSTFELDHLFSTFRNDSENEWIRDLPLTGARFAIRSLQNAINLYHLKSIQNRFPKYKKKSNSLTGSYQIRNDRFVMKDGKIKIEGLNELIDVKYNKEFNGYTSKLYRIYISRNCVGEYFVSFSIQEPKKVKAITFDKDKDNVIGIDLNVKDRFVCSNGYRSGSPKLTRYKKHLARYQRRCSKDIERRKVWEKTNPDIPYVKSKRELKREKRYKKMEVKINNVITTFIHTETKRIINMNPSTIVMEHMDNMNILSNKYVAKVAFNASFFKCREIMQNKCIKYSIPFITADKKYPSTQLCSNCGHRYKIGKSRLYQCPNCGLIIDRDLNAALNLKKLAYA